MIKTVLLDLDNTIFDFTTAQYQALGKTLLKFGLEPRQEVLERYDEINHYVWHQLEEKKMTREEILVKRYELLFEEFQISADANAVQECYEHELSKGHIYLPGAREMLEDLVKKYDLYLVSNGTAVVQDGRIGSSDLENYMKKIFISERVGHNKPAIEFFEHVFENIAPIEKDETVIIGDSLTSDVKGGLNAGIHTIWFNPHGEEGIEGVNPEYEVHSHAEIVKLLEQM